MKRILLLTILILSLTVSGYAISDKYIHKEVALSWTNCQTTNCVPDTGPELTRMLANDLKAKMDAHAADAAEHILTAITIDDCVGTKFGVTAHLAGVGQKLLVGTAAECNLVVSEEVYVCVVVGADDIRLSRNANCEILIDGDSDASITADLAVITDSTNFPLTSRDTGVQETVALFDLIEELLADYTLHDTDAALTTPVYHVADLGAAGTVASNARPTTMAEAITAINDLFTVWNTHDADTTAHTTGSLHQETITDYPIPIGNAKEINVICDSLTDTNHTATNWDWKILTSRTNLGTTASFDTVATPYFESDTDSAGATRTIDIIDMISMTPANLYWTMRLDENGALRADPDCYIQWKE